MNDKEAESMSIETFTFRAVKVEITPEKPKELAHMTDKEYQEFYFDWSYNQNHMAR